MVKIEKDGIVKNIENSLANDYVALGWKIKPESERKDYRKSRLNLDEE